MNGLTVAPTTQPKPPCNPMARPTVLKEMSWMQGQPVGHDGGDPEGSHGQQGHAGVGTGCLAHRNRAQSQPARSAR